MAEYGKRPDDIASLVGWFDATSREWFTFDSRNEFDDWEARNDSTVKFDTVEGSASPIWTNGTVVNDSDGRGMSTTNAGLAALGGAKVFSAVFVYRPDTNSANRHLLGFDDSGASVAVSFFRANSSNFPELKCYDAVPASGTVTGTVALTQYEWATFGMARNTNAGKILESDGTITTDATAFSSVTGSCTADETWLGYIFSENMDGRLAHVAIFDTYLSDSDFQDLHEYFTESRIDRASISRPITYINPTDYGAEPRSGDCSVAFNAASDDMMRTGGILQVPPGVWNFENEWIVGSATHTKEGEGGVIQGAGGGYANAYESARQTSGQTWIRNTANRDTESMLRLYTRHTRIQDLMFLSNQSAGVDELDSFIKIHANDIGVAAGMEGIYRCGFNAVKGVGTLDGITTANTVTTPNEDETTIMDVDFYGVAYPLHIKDLQNVGWHVLRMKATGATSAFYFEGGGKMSAEQCNFADTDCMLDLSAQTAADLTWNNWVYTLINCHFDGGTSNEDVRLLRNTNGGVGSVGAMVNFIGCMARHNTQIVPLIDMSGRTTGTAGVINMIGNCLLQDCGSGFAKLKGVDSSQRMVLNVFGEYAKGLADSDLLATSDSSNFDVNVYGSTSYTSGPIGQLGKN